MGEMGLTMTRAGPLAGLCKDTGLRTDTSETEIDLEEEKEEQLIKEEKERSQIKTSVMGSLGSDFSFPSLSTKWI
jgi:hypothetical protein